MKKIIPFRKRSSTPAFSLPEVAIAVSIAALALISIMGLLPGGLESVRISAQVSGTARIVRQVVGNIQMGDWGTYSGGSSGTWSNFNKLLAPVANKGRWYFDDQANPLDLTANPQLASSITYVVQVSPANAKAVVWPGVPVVGAPYAYAIQVDVAPTSDQNFIFSPPYTPQAHITTQTVIVARQFYSGP